MATLAELDEKLAMLQREMHLAQARPDAGGSSPPVPPGAHDHPQPVVPAAPAAAPGAVTAADLARWSEQLRRGLAPLTTLAAELDARGGELILRTNAQPSRALSPAGAPASAAPVPTPHDRIFEGRVTVDAGPFLDISAVTTFQQALERIPGARDVYVRGFDFNRVHVELDLAEPVALGREIRAVLPFNFAIFEAGHGRLAINVDARGVGT